MDIIAYQKAMKTKPAIKKIKDRLGMGGTESGEKDVRGDYSTVKERLEELEKSAPDHILKKHVSDLEASTAINLNKHNLRVSSLLNQNKYRLKDMIFDDFADALGIDSTKSSNYVLDAAGKKIKQVNASLNSEVVMVNETVQEVPQKVAVSLTFNEQLDANKNVELFNGTFVNTELVDNKLALKQIIGESKTPIIDFAPGATMTASSELSSTCSANSMIDGIISTNFSHLWSTKDEPALPWFMISWPQAQKVGQINFLPRTYDTRYRRIKELKLTFSDNSSESITLEDKYLPDGISATEADWHVINLSKVKSTTSIKFEVLSVYEGSYNYIQIRELQVFTAPYLVFYHSNGYYESPILDLGDNFKEIKKLQQVANVSKGTEVQVLTSTSQDGQSFSEYFPTNVDGTIASPSGRYIKVKAVLASDGEVIERILSDFTEEERNTFHENDKILFDAAAKLKTEYSFDMNKDASFTEEGTLLRKGIAKASFNSIEKVEVVLNDKVPL